MEAFQLDCVWSDVHGMLAVQLSPLDLRWMMEGALQFVISEVVDFEKWKNCIRTKTQMYVQQPEINSIIVLCVMSVIWLHLES